MPILLNVIPKQVQHTAFVIKDKDKLVNLHSTLWRYGEQDFICEIGHPIVGGAVVWKDKRPTYVTHDKYIAEYDLIGYAKEADAPVTITPLSV